MSEHRKPNPHKKNYSDRSSEQDATAGGQDHAFVVDESLAATDYSEQSVQELSDPELLRRFRESLISNILPTVPAIPGYHLCWVPFQTNNSFDTIPHRQRLGYVLVKPEEVPNFQTNTNRSAGYEGVVSYNELVLMKLPDRLYKMYMTDVHHTQPLEQERVIKQNIQSNFKDSDGKSIVRDEAEMTGIAGLARKVKDPIFT